MPIDHHTLPDLKTYLWKSGQISKQFPYLDYYANSQFHLCYSLHMDIVEWKVLSLWFSRQNEVCFMGGGTAGSLWRHQVALLSAILDFRDPE